GWGMQRASERFSKSGLSRVPVLGRTVSGALNRGAKGSFDIRGTGALKNFPGGGIDAGEAQKGGFHDWEEKKVKERVAYAKTLKNTNAEEQRKTGAEALVLEAQAIKDHAAKEVVAAKEDLLMANSPADILAAEYRLKQTEDNFKAAKVAHASAEVNSKKVAAEVKTAPQEGYAKGLEAYVDQSKGGFLRGVVNFVNPKRNEKAAANIRKEFKKSNTDIGLDAIKKLLEAKDQVK
ncbi:MAG: hypothetical protein WAW90_02640, partial [Minisyncoccia bacterium]